MKSVEEVEVEEVEYKGAPLLVFRNGIRDQFPFQFGIKKARMIVNQIDAIRSFVTKHAARP